jgi:hypothetical protein
MLNKKFFIITFTIFLFFFIGNNSALALETKYFPTFGILPNITNLNPSDPGALPKFVSYFFGLGTALAGVLAAISFVVGGIQVLMAFGSPEMQGKGRDRMKGSILGLLLTVSAFIILRTINLQLVTPTFEALPAGAGIFYKQGSTLTPAPIEEASTTNIPQGNLLYKCSEQGGGTGSTLLVWKFPRANFQGTGNKYEGVVVNELECGKDTPLSGVGSFKLAFKTPGVYYYLGANCSGYMSIANVARGLLFEPFKNNIKSIKIVNDLSNDTRFGAIFHEADDPTRGGFCTGPMKSGANEQESQCLTLQGITGATSVDIFMWNAKTPETSGDGIELYSEPFGWQSGAKAGKCFIDQKNNQTNTTPCASFKINQLWTGSAQNLIFDYTNVDRPQEYQQAYKNFYQRSGSIRVKGNYLVVLYGDFLYCQTFYKDIPNLNEIEFTAQGNKIGAINVIPIKQ